MGIGPVDCIDPPENCAPHSHRAYDHVAWSVHCCCFVSLFSFLVLKHCRHIVGWHEGGVIVGEIKSIVKETYVPHSENFHPLVLLFWHHSCAFTQFHGKEEHPHFQLSDRPRLYGRFFSFYLSYDASWSAPHSPLWCGLLSKPVFWDIHKRTMLLALLGQNIQGHLFTRDVWMSWGMGNILYCSCQGTCPIMFTPELAMLWYFSALSCLGKTIHQRKEQ